MRKAAFATIIALGAIATGLLWWASAAPQTAVGTMPQHIADVANGEKLYHIGGCISCHRPPEESGGDRNLPSGGAPMATPVGMIFPPNITPDPATGIGSWPDEAFVDAVQHGISPAGTHYIPAFPYISYGRMSTADVRDIRAYLMTLPAVNAPRIGSDIALAWLVRRGIGLWKRLAFQPPIEPDAGRSVAWNRGAYLVNGPGHCAECHTPRNVFMAMDQTRTFAGGPHPEGRGTVPSLRNLIGRGKYKDVDELADALKEGEEGFYNDLSKGGMGLVQQNIAKLPDEDIHAIAEYLGSLE
jgi:mono/diheme cytochrome c family protein